MVKNNQRFEFKEMLDLEHILSTTDNQNYLELKDPKAPPYKYHLHAILVHRGIIDAGHYYAFIRPNMTDQWYEFNDRNVVPVTKNYAFG